MSGGGACWRADDADRRQQLEVDRMSESSAQNREEVERGRRGQKLEDKLSFICGFTENGRLKTFHGK